jgi:hypothetical protein
LRAEVVTTSADPTKVSSSDRFVRRVTNSNSFERGRPKSLAFARQSCLIPTENQAEILL